MDDRLLDLTEEQKATKAKYPPINKKYECKSCTLLTSLTSLFAFVNISAINRYCMLCVFPPNQCVLKWYCWWWKWWLSFLSQIWTTQQMYSKVYRWCLIFISGQPNPLLKVLYFFKDSLLGRLFGGSLRAVCDGHVWLHDRHRDSGTSWYCWREFRRSGDTRLSLVTSISIVSSMDILFFSS